MQSVLLACLKLLAKKKEKEKNILKKSAAM
jgi:hypothetical protein